MADGTENYVAKQEARMRELWDALRTRVVSDEEIKEVIHFGPMLPGLRLVGSYSDAERRLWMEEYYLALALQHQLRMKRDNGTAVTEIKEMIKRIGDRIYGEGKW